MPTSQRAPPVSSAIFTVTSAKPLVTSFVPSIPRQLNPRMALRFLVLALFAVIMACVANAAPADEAKDDAPVSKLQMSVHMRSTCGRRCRNDRRCRRGPCLYCVNGKCRRSPPNCNDFCDNDLNCREGPCFNCVNNLCMPRQCGAACDNNLDCPDPMCNNCVGNQCH